MPDWRVGEFEGKFKDEFTQSNNSKHESGIGAHGVTNSKKLKHAVGDEKSPQGGISGANKSDSPKCNSEHIQSANGILSQDTNSITDCLGDFKDGANAFPLREENAITETRCGTDNWNAGQFPLSNVPQGNLIYGDSDLNYIDWPGIDNFEDVDSLFRTCDSTYGQQQLENTNELPWIPSSSDAIPSSSDAMYSSDVALQQGFGSSYTDYGILDDLSAFNSAADKSLSSVDPSAAFCDKQFNDNYLFSDQKNLSSFGEQAYPEDAMELLPTDQMCSGHGNFDMIGSQYSSENSIQGIEDQKISIASASHLSSSPNLLKQRHQLDSSSPSNVTSESYPGRNKQLSQSGASFVQRKGNTQAQFQIEYLAAPKKVRQPISDNVVNGHPQALTRRASYPCESYETGKKGLGKRTFGNPQVTVGSSMVADGSLASCVSSENSVEESSFRQLQDAVSQLDIQTKLCIRDGLYRLARSAQHRQVFPNSVNSTGDSQDAKDMQNAETSHKFVDPRSIETQTNPIDRSIALLLFHQSSNQVTGAVDDTSSQKSHKKQHQGLGKNQDMLPAPSIYSPRGQGGSMDGKSRGNY